VRLNADDPAVIGSRGRELRLGSLFLGSAGGKLRFRLRHVGAGHFADIEAIAGLFKCLFEHAHVALLNLNRGGIAQIVHVKGRGRKQHALLQHSQSFTSARHLALGRARPVPVCCPMYRVCETVSPALRGALTPWTSVLTIAVGEPPAVVFTSVYWTPALAVSATLGRYPDNAYGTFSSVALTEARCALSRGLVS
jgi:hypothetical protein